MAEKVILLTNALQKQEEWKLNTLEEHKASSTRIMELSNACDALSKRADALAKAKDKLEAESKTLQAQLAKERKTHGEVRHRLQATEKSAHKLEQMHKSKDTQLMQLSAKVQQLSQRLQQEQTARSNEVSQRHSANTELRCFPISQKKLLGHLENRASEGEQADKDMKAQHAALQASHARLSAQLQQREQELAKAKEKESYFEQLQQSLHKLQQADRKERDAIMASLHGPAPDGGDAASTVGSRSIGAASSLGVRALIGLAAESLAVSHSSATRATTAASSLDALLRRALRSKTGRSVSAQLKRLRIDEEAVVAWYQAPDRYLDGLDTLLQRMKPSAATSRSESRNGSAEDAEEQVRIMAEKNRELLSKLQAAEVIPPQMQEREAHFELSRITRRKRSCAC